MVSIRSVRSKREHGETARSHHPPAALLAGAPLTSGDLDSARWICSRASVTISSRPSFLAIAPSTKSFLSSTVVPTDTVDSRILLPVSPDCYLARFFLLLIQGSLDRWLIQISGVLFFCVLRVRIREKSSAKSDIACLRWCREYYLRGAWPALNNSRTTGRISPVSTRC